MTTNRIRSGIRFLPLLLSLAGLLFVAAGAAVWFLLPPPKMTARTIIRVKPKRPVVLRNVDDIREDDQEFLRSQIDLIKDPFVIRKALREPGIQNLSTLQKLSVDPAQWLEEQIQVRVVPPEHLHITLRGGKPDDLLALVKAVTRVYMSEVTDAAPRQHREQMEILRKVQQDFENRMKSQKGRLKTLEDDVGPALPEWQVQQHRIGREELKAAEADLVKLRIKRRKLQVKLGLPEHFKGGPAWKRLAAALSALPGPIPPVNLEIVGLIYNEPGVLPFLPDDIPAPAVEPDRASVEAALDQKPVIAKKLAEIDELEVKLEGVRGKDAELGKRRKELAEVRASVERLRAKLRPGVVAQLRRPMEAEARAERNKALAEYAELRAQEDMLAALVSRLAEETKEGNKKVNDLAQLREEIARLEKIWEKAGEKRLILEVEQEAPRRITWVGRKDVTGYSDNERETPDKMNELREQDAAMILKPDPFKYRIPVTSALAGLGVLLLGLAGVVGFRGRKPGGAEEADDQPGEGPERLP